MEQSYIVDIQSVRITLKTKHRGKCESGTKQKKFKFEYNSKTINVVLINWFCFTEESFILYIYVFPQSYNFKYTLKIFCINIEQY